MRNGVLHRGGIGPLRRYGLRGEKSNKRQILFETLRLDISCCWCYHSIMKEKHHWPTTSIRVNPEALHQARIAAVTRKKMLGQWLEEAILEKIEREGKLGKEDEK